jgi:hypothetical protein
MRLTTHQHPLRRSFVTPVVWIIDVSLCGLRPTASSAVAAPFVLESLI